MPLQRRHQSHRFGLVIRGTMYFHVEIVSAANLVYLDDLPCLPVSHFAAILEESHDLGRPDTFSHGDHRQGDRHVLKGYSNLLAISLSMYSAFSRFRSSAPQAVVAVSPVDDPNDGITKN